VVDEPVTVAVQVTVVPYAAGLGEHVRTLLAVRRASTTWTRDAEADSWEASPPYTALMVCEPTDKELVI
jgi:hypothetical protein